MEFPIDPGTESILKSVYPDVAARVRQVYLDMRTIHGMAMRATQGMRTWNYQATLYAQGRTAPGKIVTNSQPGSSFHNYGLAVDSAFIGSDPYLEKNPKGDQLWRIYGQIGKNHGLIWGGDWSRFTDKPHLQWSYGLSLDQVKQIYLTSGLTGVWAKIDEIRGITQAPGPQADVRVLGGPNVKGTTVV